MLIFDDSKGTSDGKERDQLQAMVAVGSEFITYRDAESTVQKSGEFVRIEKESSDSQPRFVLLHETSQTHAEVAPGELLDLTGNDLLSLPPATKLRKRARLYMSEVDPVNGDLPFREISGFKTSTRISRYNGYLTANYPNGYTGLQQANYTAQAGKRRLFAKGDGKLLMLREVVVPGDTRYFRDARRNLDEHGHGRERGLRAAKVELVEVNPLNGSTSKPILSFDVHSGLSFSADHKFLSASATLATSMTDSTFVYPALTGVLFGSSLGGEATLANPLGGDASDTYAVSEPATTKTTDGREYLSVIAVYPTPEDVYDTNGSGPYRLTCQRLTGAGVVFSKIDLPPIPTAPKNYRAVAGMSIHRTSPTTVCLRVLIHAMKLNPADTSGLLAASSLDVLYMWSYNNGASWTTTPNGIGFPIVFPYGGLLVKDKDTILGFSWFIDYGDPSVTVHAIKATGTTAIGSISGIDFSKDLMTPATIRNVRYLPVGFGGAVYRTDPQTKEKKKRLWMQFDPYWIYSASTSGVLQYPSSRAMLMVSDDGGATWSRKLLPAVWCFRVGFVVSIDERTLAVPILSDRGTENTPPRATIFVSVNGGDSWKPTGAQISLPPESFTDGRLVLGSTYYRTSQNRYLLQQDISETALRYNRGELLPMIALRDASGKLLPANPARPWMNDYKIKEPDYG